MSLWPSRLELAGVSYPLEDVSIDVTIRHGRADVFSDASPDACTVTLYNVTRAFTRAFRVGESLVLYARDGSGPEAPRFAGTVTDASLDVDALTAIAVGRLATLTNYVIGTAPWPQEAWSARLTRIFTEAGLADVLELQADPSFDPVLAARDPSTAGSTTLGDYLNFLQPMVGAAIFDLPSGHIAVKAIGARSLDSPIVVAPELVLYAPLWTIVLPQGNIVTVRYQADQGASVTARDDASIALYGPRPITVDTTFVNLADATARANLRLSRAAYSHWNMTEAPLLSPDVPLAIGAPLELSHFPPAAPFDPWTPFVEGWTDTIAHGTHGSDWTIAAALSDPLASGLVLPWNAVPAAGYAWNQVNPATAWRDALTLDTLTPV